MMRYIIGLVLCAVVSFVYTAARNDDPGRAIREGAIIFGYIVASMLALAIFVYALCDLK